jgi:hypothetical protein
MKRKPPGGKMSPDKAHDEVAVLLSEVEIGPYRIKPWSFGKFKKVFPIIMEILPVLKGQGLTLENAQEVLVDKGPEIIGGILPILTPLIAATLDISEDEVDALDFGEVAVIGLTIISQNLGRLKNSLPLIMDRIGTVIRAA